MLSEQLYEVKKQIDNTRIEDRTEAQKRLLQELNYINEADDRLIEEAVRAGIIKRADLVSGPVNRCPCCGS